MPATRLAQPAQARHVAERRLSASRTTALKFAMSLQVSDTSRLLTSPPPPGRRARSRIGPSLPAGATRRRWLLPTRVGDHPCLPPGVQILISETCRLLTTYCGLRLEPLHSTVILTMAHRDSIYYPLLVGSIDSTHLVDI